MSETEIVDRIIIFVFDLWPNLVALALVAISIVASAHAIMHKKQPSAAISWSGVIWLSPLFGAALYWIFGINRIKRRAGSLRSVKALDLSHHSHPLSQLPDTFAPPYKEIARYGENAHLIPLTPGNDVDVLVNGDEAYPAMLAAIDHAKDYIFLSSDIFDNDQIGKEFVAALDLARQRKVAIRVLVDGTGSRYSFPTIMGELRKHHVTAARFLPNFVPWHIAYLNLRNHRKIMIVDGQIAFTGGMNIRQGNLVLKVPKINSISDLHFKVRGQVLHEILKTFIEDWYFATNEDLQTYLHKFAVENAGSMHARGLADGPDVEEERILGVTLAALRAARHTIKIMTPYFVPDTALVQSLTTAAMSGVTVEILIPQRNNLRIVGYATMAILPELLQGNCRVYASQPPFDHSKIMLVDDCWTMIGSSNWDTRSFRLNFEFNVECFDQKLNQELKAIFNAKMLAAQPVSAESLEQLGYIQNMRNRFARLFSPYL